jgi:hypothetical protein
VAINSTRPSTAAMRFREFAVADGQAAD